MSQNYLSSAERRAMAILDAYGARPEHWPSEERQATLDSIARSASLQRYQVRLEDLELCIEAAQAASLPSAHEVHALQQRILASLPNTAGTAFGTRGWQRLFDRLITPRYAVALAALTVLAIVLAVPHSPTHLATQQTANSAYASWSWYDVTGQDLAPAKHTTAALTMTDFIDLEIEPDGS